MEVCKIVEGQRYSKKLNDKQVTNIFRATCQRPQQREQSIHEMVLHNKYADKFAQEFGIKVCSDLVSVPARVLPPPMLRYHDSGKEKTCAPSVGQWNMINKKMINGGIIDNWACVSFSRIPPEEVHRFCCDLIQVCNMTGMSVNPRPLVDNRSASPNHIENALRDVYRRSNEMLSKQGNKKQLQLLIVILPEVSGSYGKIKKVCETDLGIVSQCCLPRHAARPNKQYMENVALKINVKVGGRNTVLERAFVRNGVPFVSEVPTIIFGADVTHPPTGEDSASSIAAVVASMDWPEITKYRGLVSAQPHRQEIIEDLFSVNKDPQRGNVNVGMIRELLIAFHRKTGRRPERILFYRDDVSEGQFSHVLLHEMDAIRKACASLEEGYMPPVTFVVVQKRHHTRLFPEVHGRRDMTDKSGNILPGTVVDLMICHPTEFDFYLCSHAGIQGTSRPTHYHVLYDENHFTADVLQSLTNNLCYTYARCTRAVSVGKIKKVCETDLGIVCQCCLPRHAARPNKQYMENVAPKMNMKVGRPPSIEKAFTRFGVPAVENVPTIIFGADVTHPPPGEDSASSIAAVVASMDWPEITKYRGLVSAQPHRQEIIEDLFSVNKDPQRGNVNGGMIRELLIAFRRKTGRRPERILFYRDGVRESQLSHVRLHEMDAIRKACVEEGCLPQIIYIVIDKIHYRWPVPEVQGRRGNILLGSDSTQDSPVQPEHVHISISTPAGRLTVDIPFNGTCLDLKEAIESKIEAPIDNLSLKIGNSSIDYNQTLEFYGIKENSLLRMDPKMRGGADRNLNDPEGSKRRASRKSRKRRRTDRSIPHRLMQPKRPRKRTRKNRSNNNANAQPAMLPMPIQITSLANYANSTQLFRWITIRDPKDSNESHDEEVIDIVGCILGKSLIEIFVNAVQRNRTWNGLLTIDDFCVVGGRVFCLIDPIDSLTELGFQADSYFLAQLIKIVFRTEGKQLLFMNDLIFTLENASRSVLADGHVDDNGVLRVRSSWGTYLITHYAFKNIIERGISTSNLMLFFNDLRSEEDKEQFIRDCNDTTCYAWNRSCGEAWSNYMFLPTLDFALEHHNKEYFGRGFRILQFVRDFNTHSPVVPWHLRDLSATLVIGIVICRIIKFLLEQGWDIGKALGA